MRLIKFVPAEYFSSTDRFIATIFGFIQFYGPLATAFDMHFARPVLTRASHTG
jgi:hypothetical protein